MNNGETVPEPNEFKKRNQRLVQLFRTPAAPRIKEAVERRAMLLRSNFMERHCAAAVALEMQIDATTVRKYWRLYARDPATYDAVQVSFTWKHFQLKRAF